MSVDAIIMAVLSYACFVGGFIVGMIKIIRSEQK